MQTFTIALAIWAFLRALDEEETHPRFWAIVLAANLGAGLLLKSLIGVVFPAAVGLIYLLVTRQLFSARTWKRLHPFSGALIAILIAAPWHILATLRNPPLFRVHAAQRPGPVPRFSLVLLYQRAASPFPESALPARLQHRPAHCGSGCCTWFGCFPGASISPRSRSFPSSQWIAPGRPVCWRSAGRASYSFSSRFQQRRNTIRCRVIRPWRCCWARRWRREATGYAGARARFRSSPHAPLWRSLPF